jgi:hypothetical protein
MAIQVFVISYETKASTYKAYLLAESKADAMTYLKTEMGKEEGFRIQNFESREEIHAITTQVLDKIRGPKQEVTVVENTKLVCPWCESTEYESNHALKMHIVKTHADSKKK